MTAGPELVRVELGEDQVAVRLLELARFGDLEFVAREFLTSPEAAAINGQTLVLDGGGLQT